MRPAELIDRYLLLQSQRASCVSAVGMQLERLRLNMPAGQGNDAEERASYFSHLSFMIRQLTETERRVVFAMRTPIGTKEYKREVRTGDLFVRERDNGDGTPPERVQETAAGERFFAPAREGWVVVSGSKPVYPTRDQTAKALDMTFDDVKRTIRSAYDRLENLLAKEA